MEWKKLGSMFVWIPRYAYSINEYKVKQDPILEDGITQNITKVEFLKGASNIGTTGNTYPKDYNAESVAQGESTPMIVHPAFTFGGEELKGIWVAKFEASMEEENLNTEANNDVTTKTIKVVPNKVTWRYIREGNAFKNCLNMKEKLNYIYKACIIKDSLYGKSVMKKIEKLNIDSNILLYYIVGSIAFMENNTEARVKNVKTNQGKQKCILSFPVVEKYFFKCLDLDYTLLHELIHICEAEQDSDFSIFMTNENYHYFNEFRTDEKAIRLLSKLRQDNIYIFNQDNDSISTESDYNKFIPLIEPLLDAYRELIDYCAVTNEISPLYKTLGKENFDNYCKSLNDIGTFQK